MTGIRPLKSILLIFVILWWDVAAFVTTNKANTKSRNTEQNRHVLLYLQQEFDHVPSTSAPPLLSRRTQDTSTPSHSDANKQNQQDQSSGPPTTVLALALAVLIALPNPVHAGYGPSSGATTSATPGLHSPSHCLEIYDLVDNTKLDVVIGSTMDVRRLVEFNMELDDIIANKIKEQEELERARILKEQIEAQEQLLARLDAQPDWFNYVAAFLGSLVSTVIMHPMDTIKTRLQLQATTNTTESSGLTGNIWKEGPSSALSLGVYEAIKSSFARRFPAYLMIVYVMAGAAGELVGSVVGAPAEAVKSLMQSSPDDTTSAMDAAQQVLGTEGGRRNVVNAWSAAIARDVPFGAIQLATFELVKAYILNNPDIQMDSNTLASEAIIGAFAGACGALITNPTDIITTRILTQSNRAGGSSDVGLVEMGRQIYQEGGYKAFFTGCSARVAYWAPAISIFLTCYCSVRQAGIRFDLFP